MGYAAATEFWAMLAESPSGMATAGISTYCAAVQGLDVLKWLKSLVWSAVQPELQGQQSDST